MGTKIFSKTSWTNLMMRSKKVLELTKQNNQKQSNDQIKFVACCKYYWILGGTDHLWNIKDLLETKKKKRWKGRPGRYNAFFSESHVKKAKTNHQQRRAWKSSSFNIQCLNSWHIFLGMFQTEQTRIALFFHFFFFFLIFEGFLIGELILDSRERRSYRMWIFFFF